MRTVFETREIEMSGVAGSGKARLNMVTSDIQAAVEGVEVIFMPLPGFTVGPYAELLAPHLTDGQAVVMMPGSLSALEFLTTIRVLGCQSDVIVAETGGLPFATRLVAPGKVKTFHIRAVCALATVPGNRCQELYKKIEGLYPFAPRKSVVETGLAHLTPLLHPVGTLLNAGRIERSHGDFYMYEEGMTPGVVRVAERVDQERLAIGDMMGIQLPTGVDMMVELAYGPRGTLWGIGQRQRRLDAGQRSRFAQQPLRDRRCALWPGPLGQPGPCRGCSDADHGCVVTIGGAIMGVDPWEHGRNLKKMGLEGMDLEQIKAYLEGS